MTVVEQMQRAAKGMSNDDEDAMLTGIERILELEKMIVQLIDAHGVSQRAIVAAHAILEKR